MSRKVEVACEICGKVEIKNPSDAKRYKTCSLKCRGARSRILYSKKVEKECEVCGDVFEVKESHSKRRFTCSNECRYVRLEDHLKSLSGGSGEGSVNWRGGRFISPAGYSFVYDPENEMANARGYVREHRLVMSKHLKDL